LERILTKREKAIENASFIYESIQSSQNDFEVFNAMKEGSKKLRELSNQVEDGGLQETMNSLNYRWANTEEIKNAITENTNEEIDVNDLSDLNKELDNLTIPDNSIKGDIVEEEILIENKKIDKEDLKVESSYDNKDNIQVVIEASSLV